MNHQDFNDSNLVAPNRFSKRFVHLDHLLCYFKFFQNVCVEVDPFHIKVVTIHRVTRLFSVLILCPVLYTKHSPLGVVATAPEYTIDLILCLCHQVYSRYVNWIIRINV